MPFKMNPNAHTHHCGTAHVTFMLCSRCKKALNISAISNIKVLTHLYGCHHCYLQTCWKRVLNSPCQCVQGHSLQPCIGEESKHRQLNPFEDNGYQFLTFFLQPIYINDLHCPFVLYHWPVYVVKLVPVYPDKQLLC